jgi:hypothetical protein
MPSRTVQQEFQPHWLAVALEAMGRDVASPDAPLIVEVVLPEGKTSVCVDGAGISPAAK